VERANKARTRPVCMPKVGNQGKHGRGAGARQELEQPSSTHLLWNVVEMLLYIQHHHDQI
jgi:hypothetical protein